MSPSIEELPPGEIVGNEMESEEDGASASDPLTGSTRVSEHER